MKNKFCLAAAAAVVMSICLSFAAFAGQWVKDGVGWWFQNSDGSYPANGIYDVGGVHYAFDSTGYMVENAWYQHPKTGEWYFADGSGALVSNQWVGNYYLGSDGAMMTNAWIDGYYVGSDGEWVKDAKQEVQVTQGYGSAWNDDYGKISDPFRDAPLGYGYEQSSYTFDSGLETKDIHHYEW